MHQIRRGFSFILAGIAMLVVFAIYRRETLISICSVGLYSGVIALLFAPVCAKIEKRGVSSSISSLLSVLLLILIILLMLSVLIPYLASRSISLVRRCTPTAIAYFSVAESAFSHLGIEAVQLQNVSGILSSMVPRITALFARAGMAAAEHAGRFGFSIVIAYYILCERKNIERLLLLCVPLQYRTKLLYMLQSCRNAVLGYLSGQIKTSVFIGIATYIGLVCIGVPDALLLAVFMGVFEFLPYAGPALASIPIIMSALVFGWQKALLSLGLVIAVQLIEGNVVSPYFSANSASIHPLSVIVGVFIFGSLFGFWGVFLAVPVIVTCRCIFWMFRQEVIG